jgi:putative intracellular protease/amidase
MNINIKLTVCTLALMATTHAVSAAAQTPAAKGKVLVVLSSESILPLKDGKTFETGYYLNELIIPAQRFTASGYELVFANPKGNRPAVDQASISPDYFGGSKATLDDALKFQASLRAGDLARAKKLAAIWPYRGYHMTIFSNDEEEQAAKNVFHADPQFLPAQALENAGGNVSTVPAWQPQAVQDRELITGQNPYRWVFRDTPVYDATAAERHWQTMIALFDAQLKR